jgi:hypothetical protein
MLNVVAPINEMCLEVAQQAICEISKQRQLNEKIWSGAVQDEMDFEILMCASFNEQG